MKENSSQIMKRTRSLNSDSRQYHHDQRNKQLPLTSNRWIQKSQGTYPNENLGPGLGQRENV